MDQIVTLAWRTGDPGMIYLDAINENNPLMETQGRIEATNPCGEQPLHPFDACNLGSINLAAFVKEEEKILRLPSAAQALWRASADAKAVADKQDDKADLESVSALSTVTKRIDWGRLREVTGVAVRMLDNVIDAGVYPLPQISETVKLNRRIGLGVMGWADMLFKLQVAYDSKEGVAWRSG
jgi:ribonucleoside-diphosphate reductase alpha chain